MTKLKHKQAVVKINNKSIVIYYSLDGEEMRFATGISLTTPKGQFWNPISWDSKANKLKLSVSHANDMDKIEEMMLKQKTIDDLLNKANSIINNYFQKNIQITPDELKLLLSQQQDEKIIKANASFFEYFNEFIEKKRNHFSTRGNIISLKDYNSTKLLLEDFQAFKKQKIRILDFTTHWLETLVQYMTIKHEDFIGEHKVSSKGEMADSTIKKRLDIIAEFFGYLKELRIVTEYEVDIIKKFKKKIKKKSSQKETLEISEIHQLYKFKFPLPQHQVIRDLFVFLCLTGVRYQDLVDFDKNFIQKAKKGEGKIYIKAASKTGIDYNVPLCKIVIEILEKYNYKLPIISGQHGNRQIKEALKITGKFDSYTQIIDKETKKYKRRYDAITLHKGRNTFITNLVDKTPLNELMKYTGHKKLSTLQGYIDTNRPVQMDYIKIFDL